ncbi:hypothetical protein Mal4_58810 [Maioricimonas rarisocia]|uniref:Uncharacterized protein n=1 Tax=Maioricimonas rarisocia TaxID=2528026 RepID=A0A517ZG95_9PLAN|nr:hypothetical protein Mal4_58810 [Maioricimonas rarisocia]
MNMQMRGRLTSEPEAESRTAACRRAPAGAAGHIGSSR